VIAGEVASTALADQVKSLDWSARRKAVPKGKATAAELAEVRAKLLALLAPV